MIILLPDGRAAQETLLLCPRRRHCHNHSPFSDTFLVLRLPSETWPEMNQMTAQGCENHRAPSMSALARMESPLGFPRRAGSGLAKVKERKGR
jgi:hypothetical protein